MRQILNLNENWLFAKDTADVSVREGDIINLPHTWNATDGQDGGNDYFRGACLYVKTIKKADLPESDRYYLEICGANSSADVYVAGEKVAHHDGGVLYLTFYIRTMHIVSSSKRSKGIAVFTHNLGSVQ